MSSILTALKKLEHEKSLRKSDSFGVGTGILRGVPPRKGFSMGAFLTAIALFLFGVGGTYLFLKRQEVSESVQLSKTPKNEVSVDTLAGRSLLPASHITLTEPLPRSATKAISAPDKSGHFAKSMGKRQPVQRLKSAEIVSQTVSRELRSETMNVPVAPNAVPVRTVLKVNGIAFQDGAEKVAVINGITVSNGSMIEGTKVEEIQKDRVRFSRDGKRFDIIWDKSN